MLTWPHDAQTTTKGHTKFMKIASDNRKIRERKKPTTTRAITTTTTTTATKVTVHTQTHTHERIPRFE